MNAFPALISHLLIGRLRRPRTHRDARLWPCTTTVIISLVSSRNASSLSSPTSLCSRPGAHPEGGQGRRVVEVHRQHHLRLQAGREPHPPRRPVPVGPCQGRDLQVSQDQAREEVPAAGEQRGLPRPGRSGGGQRQPGYPVEGHVGAQAQEVPAAREERQVQEAIGGKKKKEKMERMPERKKNSRGKAERAIKKRFEKNSKEADRGPRTDKRLFMSLLFFPFSCRSMKRII